MVEFSQPRDGAVPPAETDASAAFFVDRDPDLFAAILRYHDMVEFDLEALCNERSANGLPVTRKLLAQEAEYYNLQSLMDRIGSATTSPPSSSVKYILYVLHKEGSVYGPDTRIRRHKFDVPKAAEVFYTAKFSLQGLEEYPYTFLDEIQVILTDMNSSGVGDGFHWTMWAITSLGGGAMELVIRGDKEQ
jgi:hypothetical protein